MIKRLKVKLIPKVVRNLYWNKGLSQNKIAKRFKVDQSTICKFMKKHGIPARHDGFTPWNKGKHGIFSKKTLHRISEASTRKIDLTPTRELGYFCGLVIGDGSLYFRKCTRNYTINIQSTKKNIVKIFRRSAKRLGLNPSRIYTYVKTRKFPNGEIRTDKMYSSVANSKVLYNALRPYKRIDYRWGIPKFLTTTESLFGLLGGIFDAEGSCTSTSIMISSKHNENLIQLKNLLLRSGFIYGRISVRKGRLLISGLGNIRMFIEKTKPRIKKEKVRLLLENRPRRHTREEYKEVMKLRSEISLGGMRISKITGIPVSTIEDWIYRSKKPWELKEVMK